MRGNITDLAKFSDNRLLTTLAEGIPLIAQSAEHLDEVAGRLFASQDYRASEIIRGLAEEEAAKVLILLDLLHCPRAEPDRKARTLKHFYDHTAKRICSMANSFPYISSFGELEELIQLERRPYYLDGPRGVEWIFPNLINTTREGTMYIDFVRDITETDGEYF